MKTYKSNRKYPCPYCDKNFTRGGMVTHVSDEHEEVIPEGFTAARVVYDHLNKTTGTMCQSCGKPTEWNEDKWAYDKIHPTEKCIKIARSKAIKNYKKAFNGKITKLDEPEHQAKMLANRSISGEYEFSDGEKLTYTGSYEKRFLEFCDEILHLVANVDIFNIDGTDGKLIVKYVYDGKERFWIPDYYIKPFNLLIDIKDGGNNKNNRDMKDYRAKQIAKEDAVKKQGKFNYLRLTDNQFGQLLAMFLDVKFSLIDDSQKKIHIHEYAGAACGGHPMEPSDHSYVVSYSKSGYNIDGYGIMTNNLDEDMFVSDTKVRKVNAKEFLKDKKYNIMKYTKDDSAEKIKKLEEMFVNETETDEFTLFELFGGSHIIENQYNDNFKSVFISEGESTYTDAINQNILCSYVNLSTDSIIHSGFPILQEDVKETSNKLLQGYSNLEIKEEVDGYFVENTITRNRSIAVKDIHEIQPYMIDLMSIVF